MSRAREVPVLYLRVAGHTQINVGGHVYRGGEVFGVPEELQGDAEAWIRSGWAEKVTDRKVTGSAPVAKAPQYPVSMRL